MGAIVLALLLSQAPSSGPDALTPEKGAVMPWRELVKVAPDSMLVEEASVRLAAKVRDGKKLSKVERGVRLATRFTEQVVDGGMDGYFSSDDGNDATETLKALKTMKIPALADALGKAVAVFQGKIPKDGDARADFIANLSPESHEAFEDAEDVFDQNADEADRQLAAYLRKAKLDLPPAPRT